MSAAARSPDLPAPGGPVIVTGATGRLGQMLQRIWPALCPDLRPVWAGRRPGAPDGIGWDMLAGDAPAGLPRGAVILHLAGSVQGPAEHHPALARAALRLAQESGARHLFLASSAAVYGISAEPHDETGPVAPRSAYGRAKLAAETVVAGRSGTTCLRIGNVAGADAILGNPEARRLDPVPGSPSGPVRSYIGPVTLARVLAALIRAAHRCDALPDRLNLAQPGPVAMADLLRASGRAWSWGPPNPAAIPRVVLATARLERLVPGLPPASAAALLSELSDLSDLSALPRRAAPGIPEPSP